MQPSQRTPRGIRNNNPLNIRIGNTWLGEVSDPTDSDFEQFVSVKYGLRAGFVILRRYIKRYHRDSITKIVRAWAPATENDTQSYIKYVSQWSKIDPEETISFDNVHQMCSLVQAMARMEVGLIIPLQEIEESYKLA